MHLHAPCGLNNQNSGRVQHTEPGILQACCATGRTSSAEQVSRGTLGGDYVEAALARLRCMLAKHLRTASVRPQLPLLELGHSACEIKHLSNSGELHCIANRCAGSVCVQVADLLRLQGCILQGATHGQPAWHPASQLLQACARKDISRPETSAAVPTAG